MHVYVFHGQGSVVAYTSDLSGSNLPERFAPWKMIRALVMSDGELDRPAVDTTACLTDIASIGYHLTKRGLRITADQADVRVTAPVRRTSA
ncbi:hypothetical protein [Devosia naphthalenivorans]|uniref:hypothetical protein n=1 Tax=Devosia naphthalenivorans TaxID=2082392 RepID=UPI000D37543A|nr:hypothetical protein [Devosia naphthalenivorans]